MIILDENVPENQRQLLRSWRISAQHLGHDLGRNGTQDEGIIPFLHTLRNATFFTRDSDFYNRKLCHARYCLVHLTIGQYEVANFVRLVLRHERLNTQAKRMGTVIRASHIGLTIWTLHAEKELYLGWQDKI